MTAPGGTLLGIDTGFIVPSTRTYPLLTRIFGELGVVVQRSEMSMSVRCLGCGLEYAGQRSPSRAAGWAWTRSCPPAQSVRRRPRRSVDSHARWASAGRHPGARSC